MMILNSMNPMRHYEKFLSEIHTYNCVHLKDFDRTQGTVIGIRHDVDYDIKKALRIAQLENNYKVKSTYFALHTAKYYNESTFNILKQIQVLGHEIGFHQDVYTLKVLHNANMDSVIKSEIEKLKSHGLDIYGTSAHGSKYKKRYNYNNLDVWSELNLSDYFEYEAYFLKHNKYYSDCQDWRYKTPEICKNDRIIFLAHPRRVN